MTDSYGTMPPNIPESEPAGAPPAGSPATSTGAPSSTGTGYPSTGASGGGTSGTGSTTDVAKDQAQQVAGDARAGGQHVAGVAKEETKHVASEAASQAQNLWYQTRSELVDQTSQQQQRVAGGLRSLGEELASMARSSEQQGVASDLAHRAAEQARTAAQWLENREPGSVVDEVKRFARRKPGTFLAMAAGLGVLGGRLSRSMMPQHESGSSDLYRQGAGTPTHVTSGVTPVSSEYGTMSDTTTYAGVRSAPTGMNPAVDPTPGPVVDPDTGGVIDPLAPVDPRTGRARTGAGRDTDVTGGDVAR